MFSLIITIISIALVVALIAATMYYGADTLTRGQQAADAAAIISGGEQIVSAIQSHYAITGQYPATLEDLRTSGYLTSFPAFADAGFALISSAHAAPLDGVGDWLYDRANPHLAYVGPMDMETCAEVNSQITGHRVVLSRIDPDPRAQCVVKGAQAPAVVFRHPGDKDFAGWDDHPRVPAPLPGGAFNAPDYAGVCVYGCDDAAGDSGEAGGGEEPLPDENEPIASSIPAKCVTQGVYLGSTAGMDYESEYPYEGYPRCAPFIFPSDWELANFSHAIFSGTGFSPIRMELLQTGTDNMKGVRTHGEPLYEQGVPSQTGSLMVYAKDGSVIGSLMVAIEADGVPYTGLTRLDQPYNMMADGKVGAEYQVNFSSMIRSPQVMEEYPITPLSATSFRVDDLYADFVHLVDNQGFSTKIDFSDSYVVWQPLGAAVATGAPACTSTSANNFNTKYVVSMADNPQGANVVDKRFNKTSDTLTISLLDVPEAAPHKFNVNHPGIQVTEQTVSVTAPTSAELEGKVPNSGLARFTYALKLAATAPVSSTTLDVRNAFDRYRQISVELGTTYSLARDNLWGTATCN